MTDKNSATEIARLREELAACHELLAEQRRQMMVLEFATQALTFSLDPEQVIQTATGLAATLASPPGSSARRGVYYEISADTMRIIADSDDTGASAVGTWMPIAEHPLIPRALAAGEAVTGALDPEHAGPRARQIIARFGLKFAAYVPVRVKDAVHGVLVVSTRDKPITEDLVERLGGLGALTSLALTNALRHREAEANAVTDALTGLTNRRGFEHAVDQLASRRPFAHPRHRRRQPQEHQRRVRSRSRRCAPRGNRAGARERGAQGRNARTHRRRRIRPADLRPNGGDTLDGRPTHEAGRRCIASTHRTGQRECGLGRWSRRR